MKVVITRLVLVATIAAVMHVGGSIAWAQEGCPASPNFFPDFTSNPSCMNLNGNATFFLNRTNVLRLTSNLGNQTGSAWYQLPQTVQNGFSTSFQFQFTGASNPAADGIAFVIQNSSTGAIGYTGGNGGALGYGDRDGSADPSTGEGIPHSLAIEFDSYHNPWDPAADPETGNASHVAVQSCGAGPNTSHHGQRCAASSGSNSTLGAPVSTSNLADGVIHTATITYFAACPTCTPATPANIHVILDNVDLFASGVNVDLSSIGLGEGGTAYVGFTGATGGDYENQDILSWTFTPQSQSGTVTTETPTVLNFEGGVQGGGYDYNGQLTQGSPVTIQITPIVMADQNACNSLVQANPIFHTAACFVYQNANGTGTSAPVMFELTCPGSPGGTCGSSDLQNFFAELGTDFNFALGADNPGFDKGNPSPGWLKGVGSDPLHPCTPYPGNSPPLFQSNQIDAFSIIGDPVGKAKGSSGGTGSCWVLTYNTPNEAPGVQIVTPANGGIYQQGQLTQANYTCTTVNNTPNATGPYLTQASCSASTSPGGSVAQMAQFDTATPGPHSFTAKVVDSAGDSASQSVSYSVVGATDVAILKGAVPKVPTGSRLTYGIGVADLGGVNAVSVTVNDPLPPGTTLVSASGSNIACSIVNKRLTCQTLPISCTQPPATVVNCAVGTIMPLSISQLNGAAIQITVQVTATAGTTLKNTATVSAANADPKMSNNSSTASTLVTAH